MKVAVTGGSGQLGTLVLERLLADPAVTQVVSLDVRPPLLVDARLHAVHAGVRTPTSNGTSLDATRWCTSRSW